MTKIVAILTAAGVLAMVSSAFAAPRNHGPVSTHWNAGHHRLPRVQPRLLEPRYAPTHTVSSPAVSACPTRPLRNAGSIKRKETSG